MYNNVQYATTIVNLSYIRVLCEYKLLKLLIIYLITPDFTMFGHTFYKYIQKFQAFTKLPFIRSGKCSFLTFFVVVVPIRGSWNNN